MSSLPELNELKTLLDKFYKENVDILNCKTKLLTAPGDNYGSVMLDVDLKLKIEKEIFDKKIVAKMCPANEMLCEIFNIQYSFKKELHMYVDAIPALTELEKEYNIEENKIEDMFATCLGGRINLNGSNIVDKNATILLENLKISGYDIGDRFTGFNLQHSELIIKNLAQFHAVPVALKLLKPEVFKNKILPACEAIKVGDNMSDKILKSMADSISDVLKTNKICVPYIEKIVKALEYCLKGTYRICEPSEPFATIVHSDFWTNNTMILENEKGELIHNKIVDLQLPIYNSGVYDLLFFMFTSIIPSILLPNIDHFIKLYYNNFIQRLSKFNVDVSQFNWNAFNEEIMKIAPLELGHILFMFKPILTKKGNFENMSDFDETAITRDDNVSKDYPEKIINTILTYIDRKWI